MATPIELLCWKERNNINQTTWLRQQIDNLLEWSLEGNERLTWSIYICYCSPSCCLCFDLNSKLNFARNWELRAANSSSNLSNCLRYSILVSISVSVSTFAAAVTSRSRQVKPDQFSLFALSSIHICQSIVAQIGSVRVSRPLSRAIMPKKWQKGAAADDDDDHHHDDWFPLQDACSREQKEATFRPIHTNKATGSLYRWSLDRRSISYELFADVCCWYWHELSRCKRRLQASLVWIKSHMRVILSLSCS